MDEIERFPLTITKAQLCAAYGVNYRQLSRMLTEKLKTEIGWKTKRRFSPSETALIYRQLEPDRYAEALKNEGRAMFERALRFVRLKGMEKEFMDFLKKVA
jgi:hypothetical protein